MSRAPVSTATATSAAASSAPLLIGNSPTAELRIAPFGLAYAPGTPASPDRLAAAPPAGARPGKRPDRLPDPATVTATGAARRRLVPALALAAVLAVLLLGRRSGAGR